MRAENQEITPALPVPPELTAEELEAKLDLPEYQLHITVEEIKARPRCIGTVAALAPAEDYRAIFDEPGIKHSAIDRLAAIARGEKDPGEWRVEPRMWTWDERMANEMCELIDNEIISELAAAQGKTPS